jgi:hypothetical protein
MHAWNLCISFNSLVRFHAKTRNKDTPSPIPKYKNLHE